MKNPAMVLVLSFCATITALAQSNQGRIVDLSGNGIPGVEIEESSGCLIAGTSLPPIVKTRFTDASGYFDWVTIASQSCVGGMQIHSFSLKKPGYIFTRNVFSYWPNSTSFRDDRLPLIQGTNQPEWVSVSAATFADVQLLTSEMVAAGFGTGLAATTEVATSPLPTKLGERQVFVKDAVGVEKAAKLLFVAPQQINYIVPEGLADGPAVIRLVDIAGNPVKTGLAEIRRVWPGIFTANADGTGVPAAVLLRVKPGNVQSYEPVARYDETVRRFVPLPIDLGSEDEIVVLALFGTGWRQTSSMNDIRVMALHSSFFLPYPVEYAGPQPAFEGLDQINVRLPRDLIGKGDVSFGISYKNIFIPFRFVQLNFK